MGTMGTSGRKQGDAEPVPADGEIGPPAAEASLQDLQQENESLKELVVSLSELVIKRVADQH